MREGSIWTSLSTMRCHFIVQHSKCTRINNSQPYNTFYFLCHYSRIAVSIFDDWPGEVTPMFATKAAITMTTVTNSTVYCLRVLSGHKSSFCYNLSYSFQMSLGKPGYPFILSAYFLSIFQERLKSTVIHNVVRR